MSYRPDLDDPLAGGRKTPSLSWKGLPVGSIFSLEVLEPTKLLQSRDYDTNELNFWDAEKTQPVMSAVINVLVKTGPHSMDEERSVWAQKPSSLFVALADAQTAAGHRIAIGGTLHIKFSGEVPHKNTRFNHIKQYQVKYEPPAADPFTPTAYTVAPTGVTPQATPPPPPAGWPGAARPAQQTNAAPLQATLTVCQATRIDPVTGQPAGICGATAVTSRDGQSLCAVHHVQGSPAVQAAAAQAEIDGIPF